MTKEVKIGLIGIAALAMLIFGINYLKGINMFQSANYYYQLTAVRRRANGAGPCAVVVCRLCHRALRSR